MGWVSDFCFVLLNVGDMDLSVGWVSSKAAGPLLATAHV